MEQIEEELEHMSSWLTEQGFAPDSSQEAQLCFLWRVLECTRSRLSSVTRDQDMQRSQHLAEMTEVHKSLEQIRIFTGHKDVLAQEIQEENDRLKDQLQQLISLQDAQISEVAKMLYQQGLTELIHSSPSEQVAYLLVERASILETSEGPIINNNNNSSMDNSAGAGNTAGRQGSEIQAHGNARQGALPHHGHSSWRRLLGLHKASHRKHGLTPAEARHSTEQSNSMDRKWSRLERDLEEGSRRLAMAHTEIRRLTDELESARLTQRAYESELQAAQQEVEKLEKCEMVEVRKEKELNDRLDLEIRALRVRVRALDAEKSCLQRKVLTLQKEVVRLETELQEQQQQQQQSERQLHAVQVQLDQTNELAECRETELNQSHRVRRDLQNKLSTQEMCLLDKDTEMCYLKQHLDNYLHKQLEKETTLILDDSEQQTQLNEESEPHQSTRDECETLKAEICETLKRLDKERSKYHAMKEKHKARMCSAKQKLDDETTWRDERIKGLERELSLCSHSLTKVKELVASVTVENEKLLSERTGLLRELSEKDGDLTAASSKRRVDFLEVENKKLGNQIIHLCSQLAVLERRMQNMQSQHVAEELKKKYNPDITTPPSVQSSSVTTPTPSKFQILLDHKDVTSSSPRPLIPVT
ncbi:myosin-9 [Solea solea]|uniref:myosin-9 n=1 Tax=Solea solea TaxID=90069 RepID=UPI00272D829B|nr:myosin-9 [Solea solea]